MVIAATDPAVSPTWFPSFSKPIRTFRFAEDDVHAEEVQVHIFIADTGLESRLNRRGTEKEPALADKNACLLADAVMLGADGSNLLQREVKSCGPHTSPPKHDPLMTP
jgi:hypothetical protein